MAIGLEKAVVRPLHPENTSNRVEELERIRKCIAGCTRCWAPCRSGARACLRRCLRCACARREKMPTHAFVAVYFMGTCNDEDSSSHHCGRQRRVSSAERTRAAGAPIPFRASWLKAGRGKRGRFSRPWRQPSVIGANEAGGSRRCASVNQGGTARAFSRPWTG